METKTKFTAKDCSDWRAYERVRKGGRFNMYDPRARREAGLSGERYSFVMQHFTELKAANVLMSRSRHPGESNL